MHGVGEGIPGNLCGEEDFPSADENVVSDAHGVGGIPLNSRIEHYLPSTEGNVVSNAHGVGGGRPVNSTGQNISKDIPESLGSEEEIELPPPMGKR